jgi:hypothetical protein
MEGEEAPLWESLYQKIKTNLPHGTHTSRLQSQVSQCSQILLFTPDHATGHKPWWPQSGSTKHSRAMSELCSGKMTPSSTQNQQAKTKIKRLDNKYSNPSQTKKEPRNRPPRLAKPRAGAPREVDP